ncbi:MAG: hypothetical protein JSV68_11960 [Anaerolineaceae bacterium]|nr:MAG: hypothetical protein JSV68_11960 [Anaerolineaceae bacterium]
MSQDSNSVTPPAEENSGFKFPTSYTVLFIPWDDIGLSLPRWDWWFGEFTASLVF